MAEKRWGILLKSNPVIEDRKEQPGLGAPGDPSLNQKQDGGYDWTAG
ncbi:hypothetical protein LI178_06680 [Enterocloster bolteae]|nr:hypothetical protein [Enterocloster bolteae]